MLLKLRWLVACISLFLAAGCSHNVPLRHSFQLSNPPNPKVDKKILVVMPQDQAELVIKHHPGAFSDFYVFKGGPAFKDLLLDVLNQIFSEVAFSNTGASPGFDHDLAVKVDLSSWDIKLSIYTGNVVKLGVNYTVRDGSGGEIANVPTNVSSEDQYSGGELAAVFLLGAFYSVGKMKESAGAAWDKASMISIGMILDKLLALTKTD